MSTPISRRTVHLVVVGLITVVAALAPAGTAVAGRAAPSDRSGGEDAYTVMDDYVRTLVYWHHHPSWLPDEQAC